LQDRIGSLEAGKDADLLLIDLRRPHLTPLYDVYAHLVYAVAAEDVTTVMIRGRVVMRDRCLLTLDEAEALAGARALAGEIAAAMSTA
jgi:5-methylthioadenosine/S-adenosylhomocysteine deaminase